MNCPMCNVEMKKIPGGISKKSGKPYDAFYSCPECKGTINPQKGSVPVATPTPQAAQKYNNDNKNKAMVLSYAKDIAVAKMAAGIGASDPVADTIEIYHKLLEELEK
jgi:hypothetical protein